MIFRVLFSKGRRRKEHSRYKDAYFLLAKDGEVKDNLEGRCVSCYDDQLGNGSVKSLCGLIRSFFDLLQACALND